MRRIFLAALSALLFIIGCKKPKENFEFARLDTYWPVTKGSYWKYKNRFKDGHVEVTNITMTGVVTVVDGKNRYEYSVNHTVENTPPNGQAIGYYLSENGLIFVSVQGSTERMRLDENAPIGEPWIISKSNDYLNTGRIIEKGLIRTVGGKKYRDVIHVQEMEQYNARPSIVINDIYIAKGIGCIESISTDALNTSALIEYTIK